MAKVHPLRRVPRQLPLHRGVKMTHKLCRGDSRIARSHYGKTGRFVNRPYRMMETVCAVMRQHRILAFPIGEVCPGTRCVPNEFPLRETSRATDEGMQAAGTAWCEALLSSIHHQAPTAEDVFRFRIAKSSVFSRRRKTPRDAARLVQLSPKGSLRGAMRPVHLTPCTGEPKSRAVQIARDFSLQNTLAILRPACYNKEKDYRERNPP